MPEFGKPLRKCVSKEFSYFLFWEKKIHSWEFIERKTKSLKKIMPFNIGWITTINAVRNFLKIARIWV